VLVLPDFEVKASLVSVSRFKGSFRSNFRSGSNVHIARGQTAFGVNSDIARVCF